MKTEDLLKKYEKTKDVLEELNLLYDGLVNATKLIQQYQGYFPELEATQIERIRNVKLAIKLKEKEYKKLN